MMNPAIQKALAALEPGVQSAVDLIDGGLDKALKMVEDAIPGPIDNMIIEGAKARIHEALKNALHQEIHKLLNPQG